MVIRVLGLWVGCEQLGFGFVGFCVVVFVVGGLGFGFGVEGFGFGV